jgi:opacity protein-like surface antigen
MFKKAFLPVLGVCLFAVPAFAQDFKSEVNVQGIAVITKSTNDLFSSTGSATRSGGFLAGYRYHLNSWFAIEGDYAFTRNTQNFFDPLTLGQGVQTNIHELTAAAVITASSRHRVRPYLLAGGGGLFFRPTNSTANVLLGLGNALGLGSSQTKPAFLYGGGVDVNLTRFLALRGEYRGLVFNAPGFQIPGLSFLGLGTPGLSHMAQPSVGLVWRF